MTDAKHSYYYIPVGRNKVPLTRNGEKDASSDVKQILEWRKQFPNCNLAICTGPSGLIGVDEDTYKEVYKKVPQLEALPTTVEWRSGNGGRVRVFRGTVRSKNAVFPGIDVKSATGYLLIPPSVNAAGKSYEWVNPPSTTEVAKAPDELVRLIRVRYDHTHLPTKFGMLGASDKVYLRAGDGRWEHLRRLGGLMRRAGCGAEILLAALSMFVEHHCEYDDSLRRSEVERLVRWLMTRPPGDGKEELADE